MDKRLEKLQTCMRDRTTWYGYVTDNAASLLEMDMTVYAKLDYGSKKSASMI